MNTLQMMDNKELELRLEQIKPLSTKFYNAYEEDCNKVRDVINDYLKTLAWPDGLELLPLKSIRIDGSWGFDHERYAIRNEIEFKTNDADRLSRGYNYDFGSTFSLYIYPSHIEINAGTCGSYTSKDLGQLSRVYLIANIWNHEKEFVDAVNNVVNTTNKDAYHDVRREIDNIEGELRDRARRAEEDAIKKQLTPGKYLASKRATYLDTKIDEKTHQYVNYTPIYKYYDFYKIDKITDKNVIVVDDYWNDRHYYKINDVVYDLKSNQKVLLDSKKDYDLREVGATA